MKILFIASTLGIGLMYHMTLLAIGLKKKGHDVSVLSGPDDQVSGLSEALKKAGITHFISNSITKRTPYDIYRCVRDIQRILKNTDFEIVHAQGVTQALEAYLALKSISGKKPSIVTSIHYLPDEGFFKSLKFSLIANILNRTSDMVVPISNYTEKILLEHWIGNEKTITAHNAIDMNIFDAFAQKPATGFEKISNDKPVIVCISNLIPIKGIEFYIRAAGKLLEKKSAKFYVIGDGPQRGYLEKLTYQLGISDSVIFTRRVQWPDIYWILSNVANVCVSASLLENFPFYILECMAARKPIVATNVGGVSEAVIDGVTGYLVPPRDPASLAMAMIKLIENPDRAIKMGIEARRIVEQKFSMQVITEKLGEIYEITADRGRS